MRARILAAALTLGFGCAGGMRITATTPVMTMPELVYIEPGIQVVVDSDVPIFYTDDYYWRYEDNRWYRSHVASGGWTRFDTPPQHLRRIERPQQYVHYRPRDHRTQQSPPIMRDHEPLPTMVRDRQQPAGDDRHREDGRGKDKDKDRDHREDKQDRDEHPSRGPH